MLKVGSMQKIHIIGSGLAGSEAAYALAEKGYEVFLHEMRPVKMTPAHKTSGCAELVCSNTFKSTSLQHASGILKEEMKAMNSMILKCALENRVPGGEALSVDRNTFSAQVTELLESHPRIHLEHDEVSKPFDDAPTLIATGPLTSDALANWILEATGQESLYFYDAIAPTIETTSIDMNHAYFANRYGKGMDTFEEPAYLNCPLNKEEYEAFVQALLDGEKVPPQRFEKEIFFQGCQPIEAIASTGTESLRFGAMKPVGLDDPKTGKRPYAVVQLRPENNSKSCYGIVGFQTKLKYPEQKRIFRLIPALKNAEFLRMGSIHRNTYVCGPKVLRPDLSLVGHPHVYLAGQITGVEGYLESAACGLMAAFFISQRLSGKPHRSFPANTAMGSLLRYITGSEAKHFQPSHIHFGLMEALLFKNTQGLKKKELRNTIASQCVENFQNWWTLQ